MNFIAKLLLRYILKLPPGIDYVDGRFLVDMTKFKPGMKPFEMDYKNGKAYFNEYGTRLETKNGDTHWHWRDGKVDRYVTNLKSVEIEESVLVKRRVRTELNHGYRLSWYFFPSGELHATFDAKGYLDQINAEGLKTRHDNDGGMVVTGVGEQQPLVHTPPEQDQRLENPPMKPLVIVLPGYQSKSANDEDLADGDFTDKDLKILRGEIKIPPKWDGSQPAGNGKSASGKKRRKR